MKKIGIVAEDGIKFFLIFGILGAAGIISSTVFPSDINGLNIIKMITGVLFTSLALFSLYFFRNPKRNPPEGRGLIISPADGKVVMIKKVFDDYTGDNSILVSVFMNVFNVHINRSPIQGVIEDISYHSGKFMNAIHGEASSQNERNVICIKGEHKLKTVQIAGLIARRIRCFVKKQQPLKAGEYIGLIQFGSRLDVYMPEGTDIRVKIGDGVKAGESILGVREG